MKKNFSDLTIFTKTREKKNINKDKTLDTSNINNSSLNSSHFNSKLFLKNNIQEIEKPKKFTYLNQKVQIPSIYYERVKFIKEIINKEDLGFIIAYAPSPKMTNSKQLGKYFKERLKNIIEISYGVICYLSKCLSINKNIFEKSIKGNSSKNLQDILKINDRTTDEVLKSGIINTPKESCEIFYEICGYAGVKIEKVSGLIKRKKYKRGDSLFKHWWCVLSCGIEKNYFIDPLLCIGSIQDNGQFNKESKPFYFLTPPLFFLENHLPDDAKYQFMPRTTKVKEFTRKENTYYTEEFYNYVFKYDIQLDNRTFPEFECIDSETKIKFSVNETNLEAELFLNEKLLPKNYVTINNKDLVSSYIVTLIFPNDGEYKLNMTTKKNDEIKTILTYRIKVKIKNIIKHEEPKKKISRKKIVIPNFRTLSPPYYSFNKNKEVKEMKLNKCASDFGEKIKNKCYDNNETYIFEPRIKILRIGQDARFKVRVRNAKNVVVLDGKRWNYLRKKDDDIFEGVIPIKSENVVICAMRNNNIYTEVFEFLAIKKS